jgi:YebC/PmpR family DNA-binding regulatory protein
MSGHSKWAQIKRKKGVADVRRGQMFTKLGREIIVAVREGGPDPDGNFRLRVAVERARREGMPIDNIQRAIDRASGRGGEAQVEEVAYEGYAPHGVALVVLAATDNRNRCVAEVRNALTRGGGSLGETGCVSWLFDIKGYLAVDVPGEEEDEMEAKGEEMALEVMDVEGVEDVRVSGDVVDVYTDTVDLGRVRARLLEMGMSISAAERIYLPKTFMTLDVKETVQVLRLIDRLEELDDVQRTFSNLEVTDEAAAAYEES